MKLLACHGLEYLGSFHKVDIWVVDKGWLIKALSLCSSMENCQGKIRRDMRDYILTAWLTLFTEAQRDKEERKKSQTFP